MRNSVAQLFGSSGSQALFLIIILIFALFVSSPTVINAGTPGFSVLFQGEGYYGVVGAGTGTRGDPDTTPPTWTGAGEITLDIPADAEIVIARLIWTGRASKKRGWDPKF